MNSPHRPHLPIPDIPTSPTPSPPPSLVSALEDTPPDSPILATPGLYQFYLSPSVCKPRPTHQRRATSMLCQPPSARTSMNTDGDDLERPLVILGLDTLEPYLAFADDDSCAGDADSELTVVLDLADRMYADSPATITRFDVFRTHPFACESGLLLYDSSDEAIPRCAPLSIHHRTDWQLRVDEFLDAESRLERLTTEYSLSDTDYRIEAWLGGLDQPPPQSLPLPPGDTTLPPADIIQNYRFPAPTHNPDDPLVPHSPRPALRPGKSHSDGLRKYGTPLPARRPRRRRRARPRTSADTFGLRPHRGSDAAQSDTDTPLLELGAAFGDAAAIRLADLRRWSSLPSGRVSHVDTEAYALLELAGMHPGADLEGDFGAYDGDADSSFHGFERLLVVDIDSVSGLSFADRLSYGYSDVFECGYGKVSSAGGLTPRGSWGVDVAALGLGIDLEIAQRAAAPRASALEVVRPRMRLIDSGVSSASSWASWGLGPSVLLGKGGVGRAWRAGSEVGKRSGGWV